MERLNFHIQVSCDNCDSENVKIRGAIMNRKVRLEYRCMKCGSRFYSTKKDTNLPPVKMGMESPRIRGRADWWR